MWFRRLSGVLLLALLVAGLGPGLARAQARVDFNVFTVRGIEVDVTAETAAAAREAALAEGHVMAMQKLLARLLPREELTRVIPLKAEQVVGFVKDFEVAAERTSDVRYLASLTFRFKPDAVRGLLRNDGLVHAETRSKPVLVLPVFGAVGEARLWEETNPWWKVWAQRQPEDWLVPLTVPLGDLGDISAIDADQALEGDMERLSAIAARYGAQDVLITQAVLLGDPTLGEAVLQVGTSRLGAQMHQTIIENYQQLPSETAEALLARVAEAVDTEIQESWKQRNLLRPGSTRRKISVTVPIEGLDDWLKVKKRLKTVAAVQRSELSSISRSRTELVITFVGDEQQLVLGMSQSDLVLSLNAVIGWELKLSEARDRAKAPATPLDASTGASLEQPPAGAAVPEPSAPASE
ncbi:MAG: DUF2066 domain-containing protein [Kiloniellales bacterium]